MKHQCVIVGGGIGGLAAAVRLAGLGGGRFRVVLLEKNSRVGGKLNLWEAPHPDRPHERSFRFDTGPSLLTLPFVFDDLFAAGGADVRDVLPITKLDPIARYRWADGTTLDARANADDLEAELRRLAPADVDGWKRFADRGRNIWELTAELFLFKSPEQALRGDGRFSPAAAVGMLTIPFRIGMFGNYAKAVDAAVAHPKLREVLYQYATYSGASPFKAPATLAVIPHAETHFGGWYVNGGMYRLAERLETLARQLGVDIRTNAAVKRVVVEASGAATSVRPTTFAPTVSPAALPRVPGAFAAADGETGSGAASPDASDEHNASTTRGTGALHPRGGKRRSQVVGVELDDGTVVRADAVVCNSDVVYSYRDLIDPAHRPHYTNAKLDRLEPGGSGMVLLLGTDRTYPRLAHHNKFMPTDYTSDLRAMFDTHAVPDDPCIYVCASTRTDPSQAPDGCENLFVLASAPALDGTVDWDEAGPRYRDQLVRTLEDRWGLDGLSKSIVVERRITPADLRSLYNANAGTIYGIGSNSRRAAFLRPPNRDKHVRGLYFAGGATHPGGGLPLVALSGKIVSELVAEDFG